MPPKILVVDDNKAHLDFIEIALDRTPQQMLDLASEVPMERLRDIRLTVEENHNIVFLQLTRSRFRSEWMDFGS